MCGRVTRFVTNKFKEALFIPLFLFVHLLVSSPESGTEEDLSATEPGHQKEEEENAENETEAAEFASARIPGSSRRIESDSD